MASSNFHFMLDCGLPSPRGNHKQSDACGGYEGRANLSFDTIMLYQLATLMQELEDGDALSVHLSLFRALVSRFY